MIVIMKKGAPAESIESVIRELENHNLTIHRSDGIRNTILGCVGNVDGLDQSLISVMPHVREVVKVSKPYKLSNRIFHPEDTVIRIDGVIIGGKEIIIMAGPCAVETEEQINMIAEHVKKSGAKILRGGAYKPRTSPYSFQGLGKQGLAFLKEAAKSNNLLTVSEIMDITKLDVVCDYCDILQIGARNMQNFTLLKEVGRTRKPVLLKRGPSATYEEWLMAAEYIMAEGNSRIILCERGIRTFETYTRNTLDLAAIPVIKKLSHLPVIADPSHGTGRRDKVLPMARASIAAGADGLLIEVHHDPNHALSDGAQSLYPEQFNQLMQELSIITGAVNREICNAVQ